MVPNNTRATGRTLPFGAPMPSFSVLASQATSEASRGKPTPDKRGKPTSLAKKGRYDATRIAMTLLTHNRQRSVIAEFLLTPVKAK